MDTSPPAAYLDGLRKVVGQVSAAAPDLLAGIGHIFDPSAILKPRFFRLYRLGGEHYLYVVTLDLHFRPNVHELLERGTNDITASYRTRHLFVDASIIPLEIVSVENGRVGAFNVRQTISQTRIGERGYFVQGIWMDDDLTKFFSELFVPEGRTFYPFFPFVCKYRTVCQTVITPSQAARTEKLPYLRQAIEFLGPRMEEIQLALRDSEFDEQLLIFRELRQEVPERLRQAWTSVHICRYLNDEEMREFEIAELDA